MIKEKRTMVGDVARSLGSAGRTTATPVRFRFMRRHARVPPDRVHFHTRLRKRRTVLRTESRRIYIVDMVWVSCVTYHACFVRALGLVQDVVHDHAQELRTAYLGQDGAHGKHEHIAHEHHLERCKRGVAFRHVALDALEQSGNCCSEVGVVQRTVDYAVVGRQKHVPLCRLAYQQSLFGQRVGCAAKLAQVLEEDARRPPYEHVNDLGACVFHAEHC